MYICFCFWIDSHDFCLLISPPITLRKHLSTLLWIQTRSLIKSTHPQSFKDCIHICCIRFFSRLTQNKHQQQTNQQTTKPTKPNQANQQPNQANTEKHQASTATIYSHIFASLKSRLFGLLPRGVWKLRFVNPPPQSSTAKKTLKKGWYAKRKVADPLPSFHHLLTEKELNFEGL